MRRPTKRDTNWIPENEQNTIPGRHYHHPAIVANFQNINLQLKDSYAPHHPSQAPHHLLHSRSSSATKIQYTQLGRQISVNWTQLDNLQMPLASTWSTYIKTSSSEAEALNSTGDVDPLCTLWIANTKWLTITPYPLAAANLTSTTKTTKQGLHRHLPTIAPTIEVGFPRVLYFK